MSDICDRDQAQSAGPPREPAAKAAHFKNGAAADAELYQAPQALLPPHSVEAEQSVLGGLLLDNSAWDRVGDTLDSDFFRVDHHLIYAAIGSLVSANEPADAITVFEKLQSLGKAEDCGGLVYLNTLAQSVPSAANMRRYAEIVREKANARQILAITDQIAQAVRTNSDRVPALLPQLTALAAPRAQTLLFEDVDLSALAELEVIPQEFLVDGFLPAGHVTLLGGHGGAGKSLLALQMAICIALGRPFLGRRTMQAQVVFFSAEDPGDMVRQRLAWLCEKMGVDKAGAITNNLRVLDATDNPALFAESRAPGGVSTWQATPGYFELERNLTTLAKLGRVVLVVDNASDTFNGNEINRAMVRSFMRALAKLTRPSNGAVLLLAHVDKSTSRGAGRGEPNNGESYSGSTAWHNSARSRLYLVNISARNFELQQQKNQFGVLAEPTKLIWPEHGMLQLAGAGWPSTGVESKQPQVDEHDTRALLGLIVEFTARGEFVQTSSAANGRSNVRMFKGQPTFPGKRKHDELLDLLREAERRGLIQRMAFRDEERKPKERWHVTQSGTAYLEGAPSAPCVR